MKHLIQKTLTVLGFVALFTSFDDPITSKTTTHPPTVPPQYPTNYFQSPVVGPLILSGTFGELRGNHFSLTNLNRLIDQLAEEVRDAQPRQYARWAFQARGGLTSARVTARSHSSRCP